MLTNKECTNCFKSLGVSTKMDIYKLLRKRGSVSVSEIVEYIKLRQPTVSHHLKDMEKSGLLKGSKVGKNVFYEVNHTCPIYETDCVLKSIKFPEEPANA